MKNKSVLVGMSGGVDSSVAAFLLKSQGYKVMGAFMKNFSDTKNELTGECHWTEDLKSAQKIAAILEIPLIVLNFEKQYKKHVINKMFKDYSQGLTPNPDSLCNLEIKFPLLWKEAKKRKINYIATGHFIRIKKGKKYQLLRAKDENKDQSYFLYKLNSHDLEHVLFPIGSYTKKEIRSIAKKNKFPNYNRPGSKGVCFVGDVNMKKFLEQKIKHKQGIIKNSEGQIVGTHPGIMYFTIGERLGDKYGINIDNNYKNKVASKIYVADKDTKRNVLIVAPENHQSLLRNQFIIKNPNFITEKPKFPLKNITIRIRHLGDLMSAIIILKNKKHHCTLKTGVRGLAEGQSAVIYNKDQVLGGGEIRFR